MSNIISILEQNTTSKEWSYLPKIKRQARMPLLMVRSLQELDTEIVLIRISKFKHSRVWPRGHDDSETEY
jgi:hypothetical protein